MKRTLLLAALTSALLLVPTVAPTRTAAAGIEVRHQGTVNNFPNGLNLTILLSTDSPLDQVRLRYRVLPESLTVFARAECTPGLTPSCTAAVGRAPDGYLVPGAEILYSWEVRNQAGAVLETPEQRAVYEDPRFRWESQTLGNITAYYYSGSLNTIQSILTVAQETIQQMSALLRTEIDFPVKVWVYETARDLQPAVRSQRGLPPGATGGVTLGEVAAADTALVSRDTLALDIVRHEIAHIVTRKAGRGHLAGIPTWLNEGISVYAQRDLTPDQRTSLQQAIRANRVLPLEGLGSRSIEVGLFYGQSGAIVRHMIEKYGADKFGDFFHALRDRTLDQALRAVYGFDLLGLENDWRASVGLPPVSPATGQQTSPDRPIPTLVPFGAGGQQGSGPDTTAPRQDSQQQGDMGGGGFSTSLIIAIATAVVVIALLGAGFVLAKKTAA